MDETDTTSAAAAPKPRPPRANRRALRMLREPIPPHNIGKKPRVYCWACNQASEGRACEEHIVRWCETCRSRVSNAHDHDDYVGHAEVTDRFLEADPLWNWEAMATDERGLPALDDDGGLWIRLTIGGVTRPGYGHSGGGGVAEAISNALKNGGQRFGVGLNQRAQTDLHAKEVVQEQTGPGPDAAATDAGVAAEPVRANPDWIARVNSLLARKHGAHGTDRPRVLSTILGHEITDVAALSPDDARKAARIMSGGPDLNPPAPAAAASDPPAAVSDAPTAVPTPPAEPAQALPTPEPPARPAASAARTKRGGPKPSSRPRVTAPTFAEMIDAHIRTINSLLDSRGVPADDTAARLAIISGAVGRDITSMDKVSLADAQILIRGLGSGYFSADPPPADSPVQDAEPEPARHVFDGICAQITQAVTEEDAVAIKVEIGKALTNGSITQTDGGALVERLEKRGRQVGLAGGS